jgi:anaerobic selenocysteine-containing dehydrogenase
MSNPEKKKDDNPGISRRTLLKASVFSVAAVTAGRLVKHPEIRSRPSSQESAEGVISEKRVFTSCLNCSTRCATEVRVVNGKAVKIKGNPLSMVSEGEICPRGHVGLQVLYDPSRVSGPLKRTNPVKEKGVDPGWAPISWSKALGEISTRLKSLRDKAEPHKLLMLQGLNATSSKDIIYRFAQAYGTPNVVSGDALENEAEKSGRWMADGNFSHVGYDLGKSNYILSFGASIVESVKPLARNLRMWGKIRRERPNRAKIVVIDPRYSVTAAKSDHWIPINPGTDGTLALAIGHVIMNERLYHARFISNWTTGIDEYKKLVLNSYSPERVATITGIEANIIRQIAREFAQTKPAIAWTGRGASRWPHGSYSSYAIFCLNALVGSIDTPGGIIYQEDPKYNDMPKLVEDEVARKGKAKPRLASSKTIFPSTPTAAANHAADSILNDDPYSAEILIGFNTNFNISEPGASQWDEALKKVPYYVHIAPFLTEMAEYADIILPAPTFLEEWGYDHSPPGSGFAEAKLKQPVVEPLHDTRCIIDIIFKISRNLGRTTGRSFNDIGNDAQSFVRYRTNTLLPWQEFLEKGVWIGPAYQYYKYDRIFNTPSKKFEFYSRNLENLLKRPGRGARSRASYLPHYEEAQFLGDKEKYPLMLSSYQPVLNVENGNQNYPWAQEIFLVMHGVGWTNFAEINKETASALGIKDKDLVWVESLFGRIKVRARLIGGIHPQVVSIARGQGHYSGGKWQKGIGINPNEIVGADYDSLSGQSAIFNTRIKVYKA